MVTCTGAGAGALTTGAGAGALTTGAGAGALTTGAGAEDQFEDPNTFGAGFVAPNEGVVIMDAIVATTRN